MLQFLLAPAQNERLTKKCITTGNVSSQTLQRCIVKLSEPGLCHNATTRPVLTLTLRIRSPNTTNGTTPPTVHRRSHSLVQRLLIQITDLTYANGQHLLHLETNHIEFQTWSPNKNLLILMQTLNIARSSTQHLLRNTCLK